MWFAVLCGGLVGFALGMTGGGGGVFAVPLLVYGLSIPPREAVGISLAAVGGTALFGVIPRLRHGEVEWRTGLVFAVAGMLGAPVGTFLARLLSEQLLLLLFAALMLIVAWRMWTKARDPRLASEVCAHNREPPEDDSVCQRDSVGRLRMTSRCAGLLLLVGLLTGILSGLFGVGGGFVIVPALILFSGMEIHRAVGTSLLVIFFVSISGVSSYLLSGQSLSWSLTGQFLLGGFVGIAVGGVVAKRLKGPTLQKIFAVAVVLVAVFVITKSLLA
jgi:uncharacterized membrane protein YfcA